MFCEVNISRTEWKKKKCYPQISEESIKPHPNSTHRATETFVLYGGGGRRQKTVDTLHVKELDALTVETENKHIQKAMF